MYENPLFTHFNQFPYIQHNQNNQKLSLLYTQNTNLSTKSPF
jgi:hypothetical protein